MRYWGYFGAKLVAAAAPLYGLLALLGRIFPPRPKNASPLWALQNMTQSLLNNLALLVWFLLCAGAVYLIVRDQRRRCRVCLRRLRMPVGTGSWGRMLLLGRPRIEYICPYGHGTLKEEELQISGLANAEWTPHSDDLWEELCASSKAPGDEP
ncbi:MAG: hypothetical protein LAP87_10145 [Acidobacteriia bacterium]|nr:hypothetical protein [Terriglobia bacterium]